MLKYLTLFFLVATSASAQEVDPLAEYQWISRPLVIFAPSDADPRLVQQLEFIEARKAELDERDVVVLVDSAPAEKSDLRQSLRPIDFQLILFAKDGRVVLRKPRPWDVRELMRTIDKIPLRKQEIEARKALVAEE